jgi:hypothetical protein
VSRRPTPQTDVPVWAVLLSHVPGQTVYKLADQPLVLAWRLDLDAVQAEMQRSGMDDGVRADDLEFGLVVDGELATLPGRPGSGSRDQLLFWLLEKTWGMESGTLSLQLVINGPDGPIGRATEQVQLVVRVWWSEFHGAQGAGQNALKPKCAAPIRLHHTLVGRLGDQLFQWASISGIASLHGMQVCLDGGSLAKVFEGAEDVCTQPTPLSFWPARGGRLWLWVEVRVAAVPLLATPSGP